MKTSVPTYDEIVQRHDLSEVLIGGDFQLTASGGPAMTPDGNPKIGDDKCNALRRLVQRWRFNARVLETLFTLVVEEGQRGRQAEAEREAVAANVFSSDETTEKFHTLGEEIGTGAFGAAACAGAIMCDDEPGGKCSAAEQAAVLRNIQRAWDQATDSAREACAPQTTEQGMFICLERVMAGASPECSADDPCRKP